MRLPIILLAGLMAWPVLASAQGRSNAQVNREANMRFAAMDTNKDGAISKAEWRGRAQSFRVHDWDGNGVLSREEVRVGARRAARDGEPSEFGGWDREPEFTQWTPAGFTRLDRNRDNRITRDEWAFARETFNRADHNRDGVLSRAEFLGGDDPNEDDDRDDVFSNLDANRDGRVTRDEWHGTRARFDALDTNRDGRLTRLEVDGTADAPPDLFGSVDANKDGNVTFDEWYWSRADFDRIDADRNGRITRQEVNRSGGPTANQTEAHRAGYERGLADGRVAGREDRTRNQGWDLEGQRELEQADAGYQARFNARGEYQAGYRDGFRRGYREGYERP